jgi:hypothetical protein
MNIRPKVRNAALVGALAAAVTAAWATNDEMSDSAYVPADNVLVVAPVDEIVVVTDSLSPTETVVTTIETSDGTIVAVAERSVTQPGIIIEDRRLSEDERIQAVVMDTLAANPYIRGKIGVESHDAVVSLSGWTTTAGHADRASREARGVIGVKYVQNYIRPRIGGSAS